MSDKYTPTTDEVRETYERARYYLDDMPEEGDSYRAGGGEFDRWITAHDRELREEIEREMRADMFRGVRAWAERFFPGDRWGGAVAGLVIDLEKDKTND